MEWTCQACGGSWPQAHSFCGFCGEARAALSPGRAEVDEVLRALVGEQLREELIEHGGRLPEERRLVSALFADLSGFTALAGRLDPETLASIVDPILAGLVRIVKRGEGHVGAFAGDALLCYFGAPVAHEDDAARAVRCAHEMLAEFPALLAAAPQEASDLTLRIGVDTGAVMARLVAGDIKTDYNVLGNSVNMAQRLQSHAPQSALVVGETTFRLTSGDFDYQDVGPLQVKGRAEPLPAYLLLGPRQLALQRRIAHSRRVYGRENELAALGAAEQDLGARCVAIVAEAGTGKSRLLEEARVRSARPWYEGGCAPQHHSRSYRPWAGALAAFTDGPMTDGLRIITGRHLDGRLEALPPAVRRDRVAQDVSALLREAAPCVVVLEDLHWADQPSLDLLDDVLFDVGEAPVLLVATSREKVPATAELELLELGPLDRSGVTALLTDLLGGDPPDDLVDEVLRRSGGNPLYVGELAFAIRDRGLVSMVDGDVLVTAATGLATALDLVPDTVESLIGARIDALPAAQERALTVASILGAPLADDLVVALTARLGEPSVEVREALASLRAQGLLVGAEFVHALVQSTAYLRTTRARRRQLHLAAADIGPGLVPPDHLPDHLARHLYLAGATERALVALEEAVESALSRGAHDEALVHLYRDLELRRSDDAAQERRAALPYRLVATGELLELLGRYSEAEPHFREAIAAGAGAAAHRGLAGCLRRLGRYDDVVTITDDVMGRPEVDEGLRVRLSWEKAAALAATGSVDAAIAALLPGGDEAAEARQDMVRAYCLIQRSDPAAAHAVLDRALPVLESAGDTAAVVHGMRNLGWVHAQQDRSDDAVEVLENALRLARHNGLAEEVMACLLNLGAVAGNAGLADLELRYTREAVVQSDRMRHSFNRAATRNNLAYALIEADRAEEAVAVSTRALELARDHGLSGVTGSFLHTRGLAHLRRGDRIAAAADAAAAGPLVSGTQFEHDVQDLLDELQNEVTPGEGPPGVT